MRAVTTSWGRRNKDPIIGVIGGGFVPLRAGIPGLDMVVKNLYSIVQILYKGSLP